MIKIISKLALLVILGFLFFVPQINSQSKEAILYLAPSDESHNLGEIFSVVVRLTSLHESVNAVEGVINFANKYLELVNITKTGSILTVWVEGPSFSNDEGVIKFAGGVASPGFAGAGGRLLTLTFKGIGQGPAAVSWNKAQVLANDGKGTNILSSAESANFLINPFENALSADVPSKRLSSFYILIALIIGAIFITYLVSKMWLSKKHIKEDLRHLERELKQDVKAIEEDLKGGGVDREKLSGHVKQLESDLEEEIEDVERKLD